jgi:hypothetical protein
VARGVQRRREARGAPSASAREGRSTGSLQGLDDSGLAVFVGTIEAGDIDPALDRGRDVPSLMG